MTHSPSLPSRSRRTSRIALRLARRMAARHRGRSALVATLIAVPVAGMVAVGTVATSLVPTAAERIATELGETEAMVRVVSPPDDTLIQHPESPSYFEVDRDPMTGEPIAHDPDDPLRDVRELFPAGTRMLTIAESTVSVRTASGLGGLALVEGDAADPAFEGRFSLVDGRAPRSDREIAASSGALERLGVALGDVVDVVSPRAAEFTVVGTIEDRRRPLADDVLFARDGAVTGVDAVDDPAASFYLPDTALDWPAVRELNVQGAVVLSRAVLEDPPPDALLPFGGSISLAPALGSVLPMLLLIGGFALFEVCLLAGAAMLVGIRSDLRSLATVASVGGDRRVLFRTVTFNGLVLGLLGGLAGAAVGVAAAAGYVALTDDGSAARYPGFHVEALLHAAIVGFAVLSGGIASLVAARTAARVDVVSALRGARRPPAPGRAASVAGLVLLLVGLLALAGGGVLTFFGYWPEYDYAKVWIGLLVIVAGAIAMQLGAALLAPRILTAVARAFAGAGTAARIAARDASRNGARSVPTLAAIASTVFVAVALMTMLGSGQQQADLVYEYTTAPGMISGPLERYDEEDGRPLPVPAEDVVPIIEDVLAADVRVLSSVPSFGAAELAGGASVLPRLHLSEECQELFDQGLGMTEELRACGMNWFLLNQMGDQLWVGSAADLAAILGEEPSDAARRSLESGGAVALYPQFVENGEVTLDWRASPEVDEPERSVTLPVVLQRPEHDYRFGVFITPTTARDAGLEFGESFVLADVGPRPTEQQYDELWAGLEAAGAAPFLYHEGGPPQFAGGAAWLLAGLAALVTFAASAVALGLARADARRDDEVLDAVGAPPRLRRAIAFWQAVVVAGIGTVIGAGIGLLPNLALTVPSLVGVAGDIPRDAAPFWAFAPPWLPLGLLVLALPLLIALGSWLTAGRRRVAVRRVA